VCVSCEHSTLLIYTTLLRISFTFLRKKSRNCSLSLFSSNELNVQTKLYIIFCIFMSVLSLSTRGGRAAIKTVLRQEEEGEEGETFSWRKIRREKVKPRRRIGFCRSISKCKEVSLAKYELYFYFSKKKRELFSIENASKAYFNPTHETCIEFFL